MNNYDKMQRAAAARFVTYDMSRLAAREGVRQEAAFLQTRFLGSAVSVCMATGAMTLDGVCADFCEALCVYDWLCDRKPNARSAGVFALVSSLPGVLVSGSGLTMESRVLAEKINRDPEGFRNACVKMGGREVAMADMGFVLPVFPDLSMQVKFYFADEEFLPSLTFLWDKNSLDFVRYETLYYIAGALCDRLMKAF